ncbi:putative ankyrin repeat domain-containing protein 28 protein [Neofusicoccum parvum UCRNP2]|uniref:Putative ankyrin repeat domain-containing protein 28 protein n=1 Tax=Botryosphaeria parva (strain UCR-NP2) TaxID=1287680 RepID=R1GIW3_BOTPV|nr:putative ankyrin repeat domain-containing protein 28 protein [Neofusicoccum parvum UCRNP2]
MEAPHAYENLWKGNQANGMELAAAVVSLSCKAVIVANDLYELRSKYKDASTTIDAICNEVEVVRASLSRVQRLLEKDSAKGIDFNDELRDVFDMAITGCTVVLSCLDDEIKKLLAGSKSQGGGGGFGWKVKAKYLWKEETMMDLLQKLRGQQGAISLLFQSLQM